MRDRQKKGCCLPNVWLETESPAICTVSSPNEPAASPLPYVIENEVDKLLYDDEADGVYVVSPLHSRPQVEPAIHKSLRARQKSDSATNSAHEITHAEPVSRMTS